MTGTVTGAGAGAGLAACLLSDRASHPIGFDGDASLTSFACVAHAAAF